MAQRRQKIIRVDCRFPDTNVIVELLGYEHHRTAMQMENDAERLNRLQLNGFAAMQFTYHHVVSKAPIMVETLQDLLPPKVAWSFGAELLERLNCQLGRDRCGQRVVFFVGQQVLES